MYEKLYYDLMIDAFKGKMLHNKYVYRQSGYKH